MRKILAAILSVLFVLTIITTPVTATQILQTPNTDIWDGSSDTSWYNGSKTEFTLTTAKQLAGLAELTAGGINFTGVTIKLDAHIDLAGIEWTPIGADMAPFAGKFDGQGYTISNLTIINPQQSNLGFFGNVYESPEISNLGIINANIDGKGKIGALIGTFFSMLGKVTNCYSTGNIASGSEGLCHTGGLIGYVKGSVYYSYSTADVKGNCVSGGLVGSAQDSTVIGCYATGDVDLFGDSAYYAGGLVGDMARGHVISSFATGDVNSNKAAAGLSGGRPDQGVEIIDSYATGLATGQTQAGLTTSGPENLNIVNSYGNSAVSIIGTGTNGGSGDPLDKFGDGGFSEALIKDEIFKDVLNKSYPSENPAYGNDSNFNEGFPYITGIMQVMSGDRQSVLQGDEATFKITSNYIPGNIKVYINGVEASKDEITMESGSTIVNVLGDYTSKLPVGTHEIRFATDENVAGLRAYFSVYTNETATDITDTTKEETSPKTGDENNILTLITLAVISLAGSLYAMKNKNKKA